MEGSRSGVDILLFFVVDESPFSWEGETEDVNEVRRGEVRLTS